MLEEEEDRKRAGKAGIYIYACHNKPMIFLIFNMYFKYCTQLSSTINISI